MRQLRRMRQCHLIDTTFLVALATWATIWRKEQWLVAFALPVSFPPSEKSQTICILSVMLNASLCPPLGMFAACHSWKKSSDISQTKQGLGAWLFWSAAVWFISKPR